MTQIVLQHPLDPSQSERLLQFCLNRGVDCFSVTFLYGNDEELRRIRATKAQLAPFSLGERHLEQTVWWNNQRFIQTDCWSLNPQTIRLILDACDGSLSNYDMGLLPEDWKFYRTGDLFLGFVSHEQYAFLRLSDAEIDEFKPLSIQYTTA